jgi:WD40 repeat protein
MLYFDENNQLVERDLRYAFQSDSITGLKDLNTLAVSPDGKFLVTASKNGIVKFWKVPVSAAEKMELLNADSAVHNRSLTQLIFSPDSRKLLKIFSNYRLEVWNLSPLTRMPGFDSYRYIQHANFSPKGDFILAVVPGNTINMLDTTGKKVSSIWFSSLTNDGGEAYSFSKIQQLAFSPDYKKLLIKHEQEYLLYEKKLQGDSLIKTGKDLDYRLGIDIRGRKLNSTNGAISSALFLRPDAILSVNANGFVSLWNAGADISTLDKAFTSVNHITALTVEEKIADGQLTFHQLLTEKNVDVLTKAADYYASAGIAGGYDVYKGNMIKAKRLYSRLMQVDTAAADYLNLIIGMNDELYELGRNQRDYELVIESLADNVNQLEAHLKNHQDNSEVKQELSDYYWTLSYYQLFIPKYNLTAIESVKRGIHLYPLNDGMNTNMALAYLLTRQFEKADSIYLAYRDKNYSSRSRTKFKDSFLGDFDALEKAGIITKQKPDIYNHMLYIKKEILAALTME